MILGYFFAVIIGLTMGLLGGGGSILTVPVLVYLMDMDPKVSIALSLAIVAVTSLFGVATHFKQDNVNLKIAFIFAPTAMLGTYLGAILSKFMTGEAQLIFFAVILLLSSIFMIKGKVEDNPDPNKTLNIPLIVFEGLFVGVITGVVGVGGGFMIVPALVLLGGIPMKKAIGTSLLIISLKSFSGFYGYLGTIEVPWKFLAIFICLSSIGTFIGAKLVKYIPQSKLKKGFAYFLIVMGIFILYKNKTVFLS